MQLKLTEKLESKVNRRLMLPQKAIFTINRLIFEFELQPDEEKNQPSYHFLYSSFIGAVLYAIVFGKNHLSV